MPRLPTCSRCRNAPAISRLYCVQPQCLECESEELHRCSTRQGLRAVALGCWFVLPTDGEVLLADMHSDRRHLAESRQQSLPALSLTLRACSSQTRDQIASTERNLDASRDALTAAAAESRQITDQVPLWLSSGFSHLHMAL